MHQAHCSLTIFSHHTTCISPYWPVMFIHLQCHSLFYFNEVLEKAPNVIFSTKYANDCVHQVKMVQQFTTLYITRHCIPGHQGPHFVIPTPSFWCTFAQSLFVACHFFHNLVSAGSFPISDFHVDSPTFPWKRVSEVLCY